MTLSLIKDILTFEGAWYPHLQGLPCSWIFCLEEDATLPFNVMMHLPVIQHHIPEGRNAQLHTAKISELTRGTLLIYLLITQDMSLLGSVFRDEMYNMRGYLKRKKKLQTWLLVCVHMKLPIVNSTKDSNNTESNMQ
jgi:hypothetical protein